MMTNHDYAKKLVKKISTEDLENNLLLLQDEDSFYTRLITTELKNRLAGQ